MFTGRILGVKDEHKLEGVHLVEVFDVAMEIQYPTRLKLNQLEHLDHLRYGRTMLGEHVKIRQREIAK